MNFVKKKKVELDLKNAKCRKIIFLFFFFSFSLLQQKASSLNSFYGAITDIQ
jgi:hypothetical protein